MSAVWLKEQLLEIASALYPDRPPVVVREWTDPVCLLDPEPVGHRFLFLVAAGGDDRPASPGFDDVLDAFTAAGWAAHRWRGSGPGESRATASRDGFEVRIYEGEGRGILTFTGWTPVEFTGRQLRQPYFTLSTVVDGVVCNDCNGWGVCLECEGTVRIDREDGGGWERCWCFASNGGPGRCGWCLGSGRRTADGMGPWDRKRSGLPDAGSAFGQPPVEGGHDSAISAFTDVAHRPCACGEFRCLWRNELTGADGQRVSRFFGTCQSCLAERTYAFALARRL